MLPLIWSEESRLGRWNECTNDELELEMPHVVIGIIFIYLVSRQREYADSSGGLGKIQREF